MVPLQFAKYNVHKKQIMDICFICSILWQISEIGVSLEEAVDIIRLVKDETNRNNLIKSAGKNKTAFELLQDENIQQYVVTFCERLDTILGGGIPVCQITEVSGIPGSGKTQIW